MSILMDYSQVSISNLMVQLGPHKNTPMDIDMLRHMILNSIRATRTKFKGEYGELIICADDKNYWRKSIFPYYKAKRKINQDKSELDWAALFAALHEIKSELKTYFPYKVIQCDSTEADDIIAVLSRKLSAEGEKTLILSGDKDYIQLHDENVEQYDPVRKKFIKHSDPAEFLKEHIIRGDSGDGIPNILSKDDCFMVSRQKPMTAKKLEYYMGINSDMIPEPEIARNYARNEALIDLSKIPDNIKTCILETYENTIPGKRANLLGFFIEKKLRYLTESISDF